MSPSPHRTDDLREAPENVISVPKWGFIIYRCDYRSDDAWRKFINGWAAIVKDSLQSLYKNSHQLLQTLDFTVRDDRASLDGASIETVRVLHAAWAESDEIQAEQEEAVKTQTHFLARYSYCVHVDTAALDSCLRYMSLSQREQDAFYLSTRDPALGIAAYVNLIQTPYPRPINADDDMGIIYEDGEEEAEALDKLPDFVKVHLPSVLPDIYGDVELGFQFLAQGQDQDQDGVVLF
jgi:hypothetical protein